MPAQNMSVISCTITWCICYLLLPSSLCRLTQGIISQNRSSCTFYEKKILTDLMILLLTASCAACWLHLLWVLSLIQWPRQTSCIIITNYYQSWIVDVACCAYYHDCSRLCRCSPLIWLLTSADCCRCRHGLLVCWCRAAPALCRNIINPSARHRTTIRRM